MATTSDAEVSKLGEFEVSGSLIVSDPFTDRMALARAAGVVKNVRAGPWSAFLTRITAEKIQDTMDRTVQIMVIHNDYVRFAGDLEFDDSGLNVIVNSGSVCIVNDINFGDTEANDLDWDHVSQGCLDAPLGASICHGGVITESGFGDGSYGVLVAENEQKHVIAVSVIFITNNDIDELEVEEGE